eukprot:SRR837773.20633.p1 GENE.SRR837773.20633~~SRR837773.20633.p1  ORF type:complete len:175 (-),score=21.16 SRR837773.20633:230-754(-)
MTPWRRLTSTSPQGILAGLLALGQLAHVATADSVESRFLQPRADQQVELAKVQLNNSTKATEPDGLAQASGISPALEDVLRRHNQYRCMHGVGPLRWNAALEAHAKQWLVQGKGQPSPHYKLRDVAGFAILGESVQPRVTDLGGSRSPVGAVQLWYDEIKENTRRQRTGEVLLR